MTGQRGNGDVALNTLGVGGGCRSGKKRDEWKQDGQKMSVRTGRGLKGLMTAMTEEVGFCFV